MAVCREESRSSEPVLASANGSHCAPLTIIHNAFFRQYLCRLQRQQPDNFLEEEDVTREYGIVGVGHLRVGLQ
jgi:hypothetical protein